MDHHHPGPGPDHQLDHQGHRRAVGAEVMAVQGDVRPPDRLLLLVIIALVTFLPTLTLEQSCYYSRF